MISHAVKKVATEVFAGLATPRSLTAFLLMKHGEWDQLAKLEVDPKHYLEAESFWRDNQATDFLRKYEPLPTSFDKSKVAEESFISCEAQCFRTNKRLYPLVDEFNSSASEDLLVYIRRVRKIISTILGPCPTLYEGRFGPGATFGDMGPLSTIPDKISSSPCFTPDSWLFLFGWNSTLWAKACKEVGKSPQEVSGNRFMTVPKDATKFRGIAVEPSINVFYQLSYGKLIRSRLRRSGINLNDGQDIHRQLACEASRKGHLATLDLSNASDTISKALVELLLPPSWFRVLDSLRSKKTLFRGKFQLLEKFSSMGNGFTFELETLIFLSLVAGITGEDSIGKSSFAFGDDLIFDSRFSKDVISMLSFFGLTVNERKTFVDGNFRESCGGDFFNGVPVRSHFLKDDIDQPFKLISAMNGLKRSSNGSPLRFSRISRAWHTCLKGLPLEVRSCRGPQDLGDIVIHDDISRWSFTWKHSIRYLKCYSSSTAKDVRWRGFAPGVVLATAVYGVIGGVEGGISSRRSPVTYSIGKVPFS